MEDMEDNKEIYIWCSEKDYLQIMGSTVDRKEFEAGFWSNHVFTKKDKTKFLPQKIRKIYSSDALKILLETRKIYMDKVCAWDDKYENLFLKEQIEYKGGLIENDHIIPTIYGQAWSEGEETIGMWNSYPQDKNGICVVTSVEKLLEVVSVQKAFTACLWCGDVSYYTEAELHQKLKEICEKYNESIETLYQNVFPETEFWKRKEFEYEQEFRIIRLLETTDAKRYQYPKRLAFPLNLNAFIDEIIFSPYVSDEFFYCNKAIMLDCGIVNAKIKRSSIFNFTPQKIVVDKTHSS